MFENDYVLVEKILDSLGDELMDNERDPIFSRLYSDILRKFMEGIPSRFEIKSRLRDNSTNYPEDILDSVDDEVEDHVSHNVLSRHYSSELVFDSLGRAIDCHAIFLS